MEIIIIFGVLGFLIFLILKIFLPSNKQIKSRTDYGTDDPIYANKFHREASDLCDTAGSKLDKDERVALYNQSAQLYEQASELSPDNAMILASWAVVLGRIAYYEDDDELYKKSIVLFEKADQLDPNNVDIYCDWGEMIADYSFHTHNLQTMQTAYDLLTKALSFYKPIAKIYQQIAKVLLNTAILNEDAQTFEQCFDNYRKAIDIDSKDYFLYQEWSNALGYCALITQNANLYQQMAEKYNQAIKLEKAEYKRNEYLSNMTTLIPGLYLAQLMKLLDQTKDDFISQEYVRVLETKEKEESDADEEDYIFWGGLLATVAEKKSDNNIYQKCYERYEAAYRINPNNDKLLFHWAMALVNQSIQNSDKSLLAQARTKIEAAVGVNSQPETIYEEWGDFLASTAGDKKNAMLYKEAASVYNKIIERNPNESSNYFMQAYCLIEEAILNKNKDIDKESVDNLLKTSLEMGYTLDDSQMIIYIYMFKFADLIDDGSLLRTSLQKAIDEYGVEEVKAVIEVEELDNIKTHPCYQQLVNL